MDSPNIAVDLLHLGVLGRFPRSIQLANDHSLAGSEPRHSWKCVCVCHLATSSQAVHCPPYRFLKWKKCIKKPTSHVFVWVCASSVWSPCGLEKILSSISAMEICFSGSGTSAQRVMISPLLRHSSSRKSPLPLALPSSSWLRRIGQKHPLLRWLRRKGNWKTPKGKIQILSSTS